MKDYYVGFDIGTESVGWAVSDFYYNLCKFHGKSMWGYELFDECNTAVDRRTFRNSRNRIDRKKQRIAWLQMLFNEEISKVDIAFFQRLKESNLYLEDKSTNVPYAVFADKNYIEMYDFEHSIDEDRYIAIGCVGEVLFVVFTERKENIRLISARLATESERRLYYAQDIYY